MKLETPAGACLDLKLDSLKEACDLTTIKQRVLIKWFAERRTVFDAVIMDAAFIKLGAKAVKGDHVPATSMGRKFGAGDLVTVAKTYDVSITDLYKWSVEKPAFFDAIIMGAGLLKCEKKKV